jgi:hypothetical protein
MQGIDLMPDRRVAYHVRLSNPSRFDIINDGLKTTAISMQLRDEELASLIAGAARRRVLDCGR